MFYSYEYNLYMYNLNMDQYSREQNEGVSNKKNVFNPFILVDPLKSPELDKNYIFTTVFQILLPSNTYELSKKLKYFLEEFLFG